MGRRPSYSGKFIARAVELYLQLVKPGYLRWPELQSILEEELSSEFEIKGQDKPSPETVIAWVQNYPDAPQRFRELGLYHTDPSLETSGRQTKLDYYQPQPALPVTRPSNIIDDVKACMHYAIGGTFGMMIMELVRS